jgi:hypothetical protein
VGYGGKETFFEIGAFGVEVAAASIEEFTFCAAFGAEADVLRAFGGNGDWAVGT